MICGLLTLSGDRPSGTLTTRTRPGCPGRTNSCARRHGWPGRPERASTGCRSRPANSSAAGTQYHHWPLCQRKLGSLAAWAVLPSLRFVGRHSCAASTADDRQQQRQRHKKSSHGLVPPLVQERCSASRRCAAHTPIRGPIERLDAARPDSQRSASTASSRLLILGHPQRPGIKRRCINAPLPLMHSWANPGGAAARARESPSADFGIA